MRGVFVIIFQTRVIARMRTRFQSRFSRELWIVVTITSTTITKSMSIIFIGGCFKIVIKKGVGDFDFGFDS